MHLVGLTGGIGCGKSAVSALLASYGAAVLDADVMAREVVAVGTPGLAEVAQAFGRDVLRDDGSLDRERLAQRVFGDPVELARLNAILHPRIEQRFREQLAEAEASGAPVAVHDIALLVENGLQDRYDAVVVVVAAPETQVDRLVRQRGMTEADARARIAAQASVADRLAVATHVVRNDGTLDELAPQVERLWQQLLEAAGAGA